MPYAWSPLPARKPLKFPDGKRLAVIVTVNAEYWDPVKPYKEPYYAGGPPIIPDPLPGDVFDSPNFTWREYGQRVGIWRCFDAASDAKVPLSVTFNAKTMLERREIAEQAKSRGFELGVSGTWLVSLKQKLTATAESADVVSTIGNPVDLRLRARASATRGRATLAAYLNYVDDYLNNGLTPAEPVHSWTTLDLQLGYRLGGESGPLRGVSLSLSVTNLFDRAPPYVNNRTAFSASGFDPENASPLGRMIAVQLVKSW